MAKQTMKLERMQVKRRFGQTSAFLLFFLTELGKNGAAAVQVLSYRAGRRKLFFDFEASVGWTWADACTLCWVWSSRVDFTNTMMEVG